MKRSWERPGPRGWQDGAGEGRWGWTLARAWLPLWDRVGIVLLPSMGKWPAVCLQPLKHQLLQALHTWILLGAVLTWLVWPLASDQKNETSPTARFQRGRGSVGLVSSRLRSEGSGGYLTLQIRPVNCLGSEYMVIDLRKEGFSLGEWGRGGNHLLWILKVRTPFNQNP